MKELLLFARSALENRPLRGTVFDRLYHWDSATWSRILEDARKHSVFGLVYQAVSLLPTGAPVPEDVVFKLVAEGESIADKSESMELASRTVVEQMARAGLHPVVMKGAETARFYPVPKLRGYGDIDLYIPVEEADAAVAAVQAAGYPIKKEADGSFHFKYEGIDVDVHTHYYDLPCPPERLPKPSSPEGTLLMLSAHALKHAVGTGIGLRQLCDLAAALRALDGQYDPKAYRSYCEEAGILRWSRLVHRFVEVYLGVPDRVFKENKCSPKPLMDLIREGGNFGHHAPFRKAALLGESAFRRKLDTALRFVLHLPFSLKYAPRMTVSRFWELLRGNLQTETGRPS